MSCWHHLESPPPSAAGGGAIGIIALGGDVDAAVARLGIKPVDAPQASLRSWPGVDEVVMARVKPDAALVFPHGGPAVMRRAVEALERAGVPARREPDPLLDYPEARSPI